MAYNAYQSFSNTTATRVATIAEFDSPKQAQAQKFARQIADLVSSHPNIGPKELARTIEKQIVVLEEISPISPDQTSAIVSEISSLAEKWDFNPTSEQIVNQTLTEQFTKAAPNSISTTQNIVSQFVESGVPKVSDGISRLATPPPEATLAARNKLREEAIAALTKDGLDHVAQNSPAPTAIQEIEKNIDKIDFTQVKSAYDQAYTTQTATNPQTYYSTFTGYLNNPIVSHLTDTAIDKARSWAVDQFWQSNLGQTVAETASRFGFQFGQTATTTATAATAEVATTTAVAAGAEVATATAAGATAAAGTAAATAATGTGAAIAAGATTATATVATGAAVGTGAAATGAAAGAAATSWTGPGAIIGAAVGAVAGILVVPAYKFIKNHVVPLVSSLVAGGVLLATGSVGAAAAAGIGTFAAGSVVTGGSASLTQAGTTVGNVLYAATSATATAISTPLIVAILATPIVIAFFLFIISSGALIVPPSYLTLIPGGSQLPFPPGPGGAYPQCWPVSGFIYQGPMCTSGFTSWSHCLNTSNAIDISRNAGRPIYATHDGTISTNCGDTDYGNCVRVVSTLGFTTLYAHMLAPTPFSSGTVITGGTQLGFVGSTGNSSGPHLHYEFFPEAQDIRGLVPNYQLSTLTSGCYAGQ